MENINKIQLDNINEKPKKIPQIYGVPLVYLGLFAIIVAFLGWFTENSFKLINSGFIDSRFHLLPFIAPYGLIVFAFHILLRSPDDICFFGKEIFKDGTKNKKLKSNILTFVIICIGVFLGELVVGNFFDYFFGVKLWNYSNAFMHFTRYTCIGSTLGFGIGAYLLFKFVYEPFLGFLQTHVKYQTAKWICLTLGSLVVLDNLRLIITMIINNKAPNFWKLVIFKKIK